MAEAAFTISDLLQCQLLQTMNFAYQQIFENISTFAKVFVLYNTLQKHPAKTLPVPLNEGVMGSSPIQFRFS